MKTATQWKLALQICTTSNVGAGCLFCYSGDLIPLLVSQVNQANLFCCLLPTTNLCIVNHQSPAHMNKNKSHQPSLNHRLISFAGTGCFQCLTQSCTATSSKYFLARAVSIWGCCGVEMLGVLSFCCCCLLLVVCFFLFLFFFFLSFFFFFNLHPLLGTREVTALYIFQLLSVTSLEVLRPEKNFGFFSSVGFKTMLCPQAGSLPLVYPFPPHRDCHLSRVWHWDQMAAKWTLCRWCWGWASVLLSVDALH